MRTARTLALVALVALTLTACAAPQPDSIAETGTPAPTFAPLSDLPAVAGYAPGEVPPVPLFTMPDLSLLDDSLGGFSLSLDREVTARPGLDIRPAGCGGVQERASARGTALLYGDGSGTFTGPDGTVANHGDGSGTFTVGGVTATVFGDGSGTYSGNGVEIWNHGDGSGSVTTADTTATVYGDGSASLVGAGIDHWNYGDGSAMYRDATVEIRNNGDGSGSYVAAGIDIRNHGDGTGSVNGVPTQVDALESVAAVGVFPSMGTLAPITSCGTTITLQDGVLFDFDRSDLRPEAAVVLDELAAAMVDLGVPAAEVGGHTDAIGTDAANLALSERRAAAVVDALRARGATAALTATGYGETAPVAANEIDGRDDPAGRQLNRRVEVFIPAF